MSRLATACLGLSLLLGACTSNPAPATRSPTRHSVLRAEDPWASAVTAKTTAAPIDRGKLRAALSQRRRQSIERFLAYREDRVYPINTYAPGQQHVWRDETGRLCAAATLIAADWGAAAAGRVADENNFIKLADVHHGPLHDWILTSGLTQHEIVAIQEPMMPSRDDLNREVERLYAIYTSVERQLRDLGDESLDEATDALLADAELARRFLELNELAGPGRFGRGAAPAHAGSAAAPGFAPPPPA